MIFLFKSEAEMQAVLERGPWLFAGENYCLATMAPQLSVRQKRDLQATSLDSTPWTSIPSMI
jgi:hypothetical protein